MTDTRVANPSIAERTRSIDVGGPVVATHFLNDIAGFVLGEEGLVLADSNGETRRVDAHAGAILTSAGGESRIITGGDDGRVLATGPEGKSALVATDAKRRWIDQVAQGPDNAVAWSAGKQVFAKTAKCEDRSFDAPSSPGGLASSLRG